MKKQIPFVYVGALAVIIVAAIAYMTLVRPASADQKQLDDEIASLQQQIAEAAKKTSPPTVKVADLFRLTKALPDQEDMAGIILELNSTAAASGISFEEMAPQAAVPSSAYWSVPINLVFSGSYYDLVDFLFRLRNLVTVNDGVLDANGRLFTLDSLTLSTDPNTFPTITAKMTVSAYVYGQPGGASPAASGSTAAPSTQTSTPSSTTPTDTTSDTSQQAAGGN